MSSEFQDYLSTTKEYGIAEEVRYPLIECTGLPSAKPFDLILFESGQKGYVMSMNQQQIEVVTFSKVNIKPGTRVVLMGKQLTAEVGEKYLGKVVNPLGEILFEDLHDQAFDTTPGEFRYIDTPPKNIVSRKKIKRQLLSGLTIIDLMLPLAKGQRELIVGDRQTGKTWTLMNLIKTQTATGSVVVYCLIGKEKTEIVRLKEFLVNNDLIKNVVLIATNSDDSPSLISIAPNVAMTHAEYFRDMGKDVLVILDDLSTHAMYYREMSLLAKRFPGRDSYPGDIFFRHAKLLERAGNFYTGEGESAITTLSVAGTINNTLTGHIVSNLIGITDGHLLFDADLFNRGRRPSVNIFLSVTRVGKQTQNKIMRALGRDVMMTLSTYEEILEFSHFGAELSEDKKKLLVSGEKIYKFFEQSYTVVLPTSVEVVFLGMLHAGVLDQIDISQIINYRKMFLDNYDSHHKIRGKVDKLASETDLQVFYENLRKSQEYLITLCQQKQ